MQKAIPAKDVNEYLESLPADMRTTLEKVRKAVLAAAPKAEEVISYQIPTYKYFGALVHFAAFKNHCSFFGVSKKTLAAFEKELQPFTISGTTIRFSPDNPLPSSLIQKFVKVRMKENEERNALKKGKKAEG